MKATPVPEVFCPFPYRINPHVEQTRTHLTDWTRRTGLVHRESARKRFEKADFGWFASVVYPTASAAHADLMADWFAWLFLVDDQLDDGSVGRSPDYVRAVVARMRAVLESSDFGAGAVTDPDAPVAVSSLADLWLRTAVDATPAWRRRYIRHLDLCLSTAATWEAHNRVAGIVPDEATYITNRRHTGAIYVCMDYIDIVERLDVPENIYATAQFGSALDAACNVVCWTNDVYSLEKERSLGEVHNLVLVVEHHRELGTAAAVEYVCAAISAETERFLVRERALLAAFPEYDAVLVPYLAGMRTWMRGNLDWSSRSQRYEAASVGTRPAEYLESAVMAVEP